MKKLLAVLLTISMVFVFAACNVNISGGKNMTASIIPEGELDTLNKIFENGYQSARTIGYDNVFAQIVEDSKGNQHLVIVKIPAELVDALYAMDIFDESKPYLDLIGDMTLTDSIDLSSMIPDQKELDTLYKGMTIAEFEMNGAWITGYMGDKGDYSFFFSDDRLDYIVDLEKGTKIEDYDDTDLFDAAIQDLKIGKVECEGLTNLFLQDILAQYLDPPEKATPKDLGEAVSSIDDINAAIGSNLLPVEGATEEKFSVIDGKIGQYVYIIDDYYYCIRTSADTNVDLTDDEFSEYPLVEDGYITTVMGQTDAVHSLRFVFNNYQYAYMVYDNSEFDYFAFDEVSSAYKNAICKYKDDSKLKVLLGTYSSDDGYTMSGSPVSNDTVQVTIYTFDETQTKVWTMLVKEKSGKLTYDKSLFEIYLRDGGENPAPSEAGKGTFTVNGETITWEKHVFKKS